MTRRALLVLLCILGAQAAAASGDGPLEPPDLSQYVRWGPLRARPGVNITNLGYDDNVFFASGQEEPQGDYRITLGANLEGLMLFGDRAFLEFDAGLNHTIYQTYGGTTTINGPDGPEVIPSQNYTNGLLTSRITFPFRGGWGVFADLDLVQAENRPTSEFDTRVRQRTNLFGFGFILELGWRTYVEFKRAAADLSYDDGRTDLTAARLDRVEQSNELRVGYRITGLTSLTLDLTNTDYTFDVASDRDSTERSILPGFAFGERSRLGGWVKIGYSNFDMKDPAQQDYNGPVGEARLYYRMGSGTTFRLEGGRIVSFAVFGDNTFYLDRFGHLRATHYVNPVIGFFVGGGMGTLSFPGSDPLDAGTGGQCPGDGTPCVRRVDDNSEYEIGVLFRAARSQNGKTVEYGFSWRETRRDSTINRLDQSRGTWGFTANAGF